MSYMEQKMQEQIEGAIHNEAQYYSEEYEQAKKRGGVDYARGYIEGLKDGIELFKGYSIEKHLEQIGGNEQIQTLPTILQSAFKFENNRRIVIYTSGNEIKSFECDENWKHDKVPFAQSTTPNPLEYHIGVRASHAKETFVEEMSTDLIQRSVRGNVLVNQTPHDYASKPTATNA